MGGCIWGGNNLHKIGREVAIMCGLILILIQQVLLYGVSFLDNANEFLILSFTAQMIGGLGSGINAVAAMALTVSTSKQSERE